MMRILSGATLAFLLATAMVLTGQAPGPQARILDLKHYSHVFGEERNFRVFLPLDYDTETNKRYPVIYFFHGFSERYNQPPRNRSGYDSGDQYGGDNIAAFVKAGVVARAKEFILVIDPSNRRG